MAQQSTPDQTVPDRPAIHQPATHVAGTAHPRPDLPPTVTEQPDSMLQMSAGRMGIGGLTIVTLATVAILGVVLYGLNAGVANGAATPPAAKNAPAATGASAPTAPQTGPHSKP